jgi:capsular exopolysaccharide synthesis family protein
MVVTGGVIGLIAGLGAGYDHFRGQPAEYESTAIVSGADAAAVTAPVVLDRAARRLDVLQPFAPALPPTTPERVAFLGQNVKAEAKDGAVHLTFRGPNPADAPKYLKAVAEAYTAEPGAKTAPPLPPAPSAKSAPALPPTPAPTPVDDGARVAAQREKLRRDLAAVTGEELPAVEARLKTSQAALAAARGRLKDTDRDLGVIAAAGKGRTERLAVMKQLGVMPEAETPPALSDEVKTLQTQLTSFQQKKAELGRRLGPEHRDIVALDEQIRFASDQLAKAKPTLPAEDELDRHRATLAAAKAKLDAEATTLTTAVQRDERTLAAAAPIRARLDQLASARPVVTPPAPVPPEPTPIAVNPPAPPVPQQVAAPQLLTPPAEGERVSPLLYRSLVPGGAIGLAGGLGLGFLSSVVAAAVANRKPRERKPKPVAPPKPVVQSVTARRTGTTRVARYDGPALGVPVLGQIPTLRPDQPVEKKSVEGWSPMLVSFSRPNSPEAEAFRSARRELVAALDSTGHKAVVVTSPGDGDGKTTTAANLALSLAQSGKRVLLVDCDCRGTKQQELFRLGRLGDALKSVMLNDVDLRAAVRSCEVANLFLLPAGRGPLDGVDLLTRAKFRELVADLKAGYEYVILDAPPTTADRELKALADQSDGVILVVRGGADARSRTERATSEVARVGSRVLGAVVTAAPPRPEAPALAEQQTPTAV